jgi:type 1 fimbria pilin
MRKMLVSLAALLAIGSASLAQAATAPSYAVSAHCAGLTVSATDYPAGASLQVYTGKYRAGSFLRVGRGFEGSTSARVAFSAGTVDNTYAVYITAPGVATVVRRGQMTSCTPRYPNQLAGVVRPPLDW